MIKIVSCYIYLSFTEKNRFMSGSSHIWNVLIGVKYQNCCRTLDVYLLFAIWMGQIQLKIDLHIYNLWTGQFVSYKSVILPK
jgi:hypothetical protein